ncbi:MAG: redox-regulated ATPase YchF [Candidatus Babeliales bacterium]
MSIQAGLVGLPNVGKSTLFNALTKSSIPAENYPFCTIDPHIAITHVPDTRLASLQKIYNAKKIIPATVTFVDIAGLVKGAASGEGLGNQFLSHIREVDLIIHVLRCFQDDNILYSGDILDPIADYEIIIEELMLKDLDSVEKRRAKIEKLLKGNLTSNQKTSLQIEYHLLNQLKAALDNGKQEQVKKLITTTSVETIPLLSAKNFLIIANITEDELEDNHYKQNKNYQLLIKKFGHECVIPVCAKIEYELSQLSDKEAEEMMGLLGMHERSLDIIINKTYQQLGLITFFTCGPKEIHAWPIKKGATIRQAAGEIHSDLERGFICAEVFNYHDLIELGSQTTLKQQGKIRIEGQGYLVQDGDIVNIRFNV